VHNPRHVAKEMWKIWSRKHKKKL